MKLSLQCWKLSWSTEEKFWFALLNVKVCKYIVSISIGGLYQCYIVTKTLLQVIWRRRRASCLWRTTTRRTSEITRHWPRGTCCRRPGTCYVSSTDPSMSTCPGFLTRTSTCGQTDRLRNRYQTSIAWYIIPMELSVFCLCII